MNELYVGYDPFLAICGIVLLPIIWWWWHQPPKGIAKYFGYYLILCFARGSLDLLNIINPTILRYIIELPLIILYLRTLAQKNTKSYPSRYFVPILLIICFISGIQTSIIMIVFFLLYFLEIYMFLFCVHNNFEEEEITYLNRLICYLAISQIFASLIKFIIVGVREPYIGTMASHEGGITTVFSLVCFCVGFEFFLQTKEKKYLLLLIGFLAFGIIGAKRALAFLIPLFCFITILFHAYLSDSFLQHIKKLIIAVFLAPIFFVAVCVLNPSLNPEKKVGGSFNLEYVINFSQDYNEGKNNEVGRSKAHEKVLEKISNSDLYNQLFGFGTGTLIASSFNNDGYLEDALNKRFGVGYSLGIGSLNILVQIGLLGLITYLGMFVYLLFVLMKKSRQNALALNPVGQSWCISSCVAIVCVLLLSLVYNKASLYFNGSSIIIMWMVAYSLRILEKTDNEDIVLIDMNDSMNASVDELSNL